MQTALLIICFLSSFISIVCILLQPPKGEGLGAIGGQARMYKSSKNINEGLQRFTAISVAIFIISASALSVLF